MTLVHDEKYTAAFGKLNQKQQEAVEAIEGPVMVIAGPGTGKTQILTLRIANILRQTDTAPESILALTFTKSGAKAMRERLRTFVGATAYRVPIYTFHGLCERLIRDYPEAYGKIIGGKAVTEIEKIDIIETILQNGDLAILRPTGAPQFYVRPLLSMISTMKQENVLPDNLATLIAEQEVVLADIPQYHEKGAHKGKQRGEYTKLAEQLEKQRALLLVYRLYDASLRERARYDFDDMIVESVQALRTSESMRLDLQETFQYILADEHQDVNGAQNEILKLLSSYHENPNLFVVGDEKQAIYRFQGASLENFLLFETLFPQTKVIVLTDNYRSTQPILDAGHSLVAVASGPLLEYRLPLTAALTAPTTLQVLQYPHQAHEEEALVKSVQAALARGVSPAEIAIIVRSNREVESIAFLLRDRGIAVEPSADSDVLEHPLLLSVIDLIDVVVNPGNDVTLARVFQAPYWNIAVGDMITIMSSRTYNKPLSAILTDNDFLTELSLESLHNVQKVMQVIAEARARLLIDAPHRVLASLLTSAGVLQMVATEGTIETTRIVRRIYDEVESLVKSGEAKTLADVATLLRRRILYGVPLTAPFVKDTTQAVQVMTAHKSKGLEFEIVFIPHVTDQSWGGSKHPVYFKVPLLRSVSLKLEANEDERRLLYVAMTRAKSSLILSYADQSADGKVLSPSPLLATLSADLTQPGEVPTLPILPIQGTPKKTDLRPFLLQTLQDRGLSATSLNNCIKNPWDYLYRNVIRLPEVQALPLIFGTALHGVFEFATKHKTKHGALPEFSVARDILERELGKHPLSMTEFTDLFAKGQEVIVSYFPHLNSTLGATTKEELNIRVMLPLGLPSLPEIPLTGKLDRIDIGTDGRALRVVDYKTGKPKTRNEIEGKTAKADASYRRQLAFYSLLLHLHGDERYLTTTGVLSFVEPDSKGRIHEEVYESGEAEREELIAEIRQAVEGLLAGGFLHDEALLAESSYATLGSMLMKRLV